MLQLTTHEPPETPATWTCPFCSRESESVAEFDGHESYGDGDPKRKYNLECTVCGEGLNVDEKSLYENLEYQEYPHRFYFCG